MCVLLLITAFILTALTRCDVVLVVVMDTTAEKCNQPLANYDNSEEFRANVKGFAEIVNATFSQHFLVTLVNSACDKTDVTVHQILDVIRHHEVIGVLTMAGDATVSAVLKVTKYLNVPVVEMVSGDVINRPQTRANHLVLPHHTYFVLQYALATLKALNWTAASVTSTGSASTSRGVIRMFRKLSLGDGICVVPSSFGGAIPLVVFADDESREAKSNDESNAGPVLFVNLFPRKMEEFTRNNGTSNYLYLDISDSRFKQMVDNLPRICGNGSDGSEADNSDLHTIFQNIADKEHPQFLVFVMGLSLTLSSQCPLLNASAGGNESDTGTSRCFLLNYLCPKADDPLALVDFFVARHSRRALVHTITADEDIYDEFPFGADTLFITKHLPASARDKDCGNFCRLCPDCLANEISQNRYLVTGEGDFYIAGFFPTHQSSHIGACAHHQHSGTDLSHEFLTIFEEPRNQNTENKMPRFQGIIMDVCGSDSGSYNFQSDIARCREILSDNLNYTNNRTHKVLLQSSQILAYVDTTGQVMSTAEGKLVVAVDHSGFSSVEDLKIAFVRNALTALRHMQWTVVNIIVSDRAPFLKLLQHFKDASLASDFCYVNIIAPRSVLTPDDLNLAVRSMEQTTAYLLLTDAADTAAVLRHFRESRTPLAEKVSLVFTPWNQYDLDRVDLLSFSDAYVILRPASVAPSDDNNTQPVDGLETKDNLTVGYTNKTWSADRAVMALVKQATQHLLSAWRRAAPDDRHALDVTDTSLDLIAVTGDKRIHIATVGKELHLKENFTGQRHDTCRGWCPVCYACRNKGAPNRKSLYTEGDLVLAGLFPIRSAGTAPFQCGRVSLDVPKFQIVSAFMYALDTAKFRYPDLLPGIDVGGLVLDMCSDSNMAVKTLMDFETCSSSFGDPGRFYEASSLGDALGDDQPRFANPVQNVGYVIDSSHGHCDITKTVLQSTGDKPAIFVNSKLDKDSQLSKETTQAATAITEILSSLEETRVIIVYEVTSRYQKEARRMSAVFSDEGLCTVAMLAFNASENWTLEPTLASHAGLPAVLVTSKIAASDLFKMRQKQISHFWIIPILSDESATVRGEQLYPMGSIILDWESKSNKGFESFLREDSLSPKTKPAWYRDLWRMQYSCLFSNDTIHDPTWNRECSKHSIPADIADISSDVSNVILSVDAILHALHGQYTKSCPEARGVCQTLAEDIVSRRLSLFGNLTFLYQGQQLEYVSEGEIISTLSVFNVQTSGAIEVARYFKGVLTLNKSRLQFPPGYVPSAECGSSSCSCIGVTTDNRSTTGDPDAALYASSQGEIIYEIWTIAAFCAAASGALVSFLFSVYVMYKIGTGALGRHYIGLGLTLLFALISLYSSVLPYMFTPSEAVCSLRYFWPAAAYAFCFAVIFVKLMTLQSYKLIGLGGEVSGINQIASVFFVTVVQVASSVQWWIYNTPSVRSITYQSGIVKFACNFHKSEFSLYLIYVMFLVLLCAVYGIGVRNEKKNTGEAKLLMTVSWACSAVWVAWLLCLYQMDRKWSDVIICAGIVTCATVVLLVVFLPKLRMVSRLKYDLSQKTHARNGCSVDTDFLYERPHSLPGTLTSTFSSGKMNYPKSLTNFDAEVNSVIT